MTSYHMGGHVFYLRFRLTAGLPNLLTASGSYSVHKKQLHVRTHCKIPTPYRQASCMYHSTLPRAG